MRRGGVHQGVGPPRSKGLWGPWLAGLPFLCWRLPWWRSYWRFLHGLGRGRSVATQDVLVLLAPSMGCL